MSNLKNLLSTIF